MKYNGRTSRNIYKCCLILLLLLLLAERFAAMYELGADYSLNSDDMSYFKAGIYFAKTGVLTMHTEYPSAQIMPGLPWFIGIFAFFIRNEKVLFVVLKVLWICMGTLSAYYTYKIVSLRAHELCALAAAAMYLLPSFAWMDNLILTETPFILLTNIAVYNTMLLAENREKRYLIYSVAAFMGAFLLKAHFIFYPIFAGLYLCIKKYDRKKLARAGLCTAAALLVFLIPWTVRNYVQFGIFAPIGYGSGNARLLGTYQGEGYPDDDELDLDTNVSQVWREKFNKYLDDNGYIIEDKMQRYLYLESDGIHADYRMSVWKQNDLQSFLKSYLYLKPRMMMRGVFYWKEIFGVSIYPMLTLRNFGIKVFFAAVFLALLTKRRRAESLFIALVYMTSVYIFSMGFAFERYSEFLMPLRYAVFGLGLGAVFELAGQLFQTVKSFWITHNGIK